MTKDTWTERLEAQRQRKLQSAPTDVPYPSDGTYGHVSELLTRTQAGVLMQEAWREPHITIGNATYGCEGPSSILLEWWDEEPQGKTRYKVSVDVFENHTELLDIDFSTHTRDWPVQTFQRGDFHELRNALGRLWGVCLRPADVNEEAAQIVAALQEAYPEARVQDDGPTQGGHHFIDMRLREKFLVLQIEPNKPRGGNVLTDDPFEGLSKPTQTSCSRHERNSLRGSVNSSLPDRRAFLVRCAAFCMEKNVMRKFRTFAGILREGTLRNEHIVLTHFSNRYTRDDVLFALHDRVPAEFRGRITAVVNNS